MPENDKLHNILVQMVNGSYMYRATTHKVLGFEITSTRVFISTNKSFLKFNIENIEKVLKEFEQVEEEKEEKQPTSMSVYNQVQTLNLGDVMKNNISKLQGEGGEAYIKTASAINQSINTLLNAVKTELMVKKYTGK